MRHLLLITAALLACAGCTQTQLTTATEAAKVACSVDGAVQPIAADVLSAAGQSGAATTDQLLVHPLVVSACAAVNGKPIAATPGVSPAPTSPAPAVAPVS
jgi:hypothetical protein